MFSRGESGVGPVLVAALVISAIAAYWFYDASKFASGNELDIAHRSFMPISCSVAADRAADVRTSAQAYFWQGNVRIDLTVVGEQKLVVHELLKPTGSAYAWRDDNGYGKIISFGSTDNILNNVTLKNDWFCFPWLIPDFSKFTVPANVAFQ